MNKFLKTVIVCALVLTLTACDKEEPESSEPTEIIVSGGDISEPEKLPFPVTVCGVRVEKAVERAVSLSPAATEIICELGFGNSLVGISKYCDYPEGLSAVRVGSTENPDIDGIIGLAPDAVFTLTPLSEREAYTLEQAGIAVLTVPAPVNIEQYSALYKETASAFYGKEMTDSQKDDTKALQISKNARAALEGAARTVEPYTFIYVTGKGKIAGVDTFESAVLSLAGENRVSGGGYIETDRQFSEIPTFLIVDETLSEDEIHNDEFLEFFLDNGAELVFVDARCFERPTARTAEVFAVLSGAEPGTPETDEEDGYTAEENGYIE